MKRGEIEIARVPATGAAVVACPHKRIVSGYDNGRDLAWCDDCGRITHCSDGWVTEDQSKRNDRQAWCERRVFAFGCMAKPRGGEHCKHWCGQPQHCAVTLGSPEGEKPSPPTDRERFIGALRHVAELQPDPCLSIDAVMSVYDYVFALHAPLSGQPLPDGRETCRQDETETGLETK